VVINIAYLITKGKREIIVALETGHGKTIVIQLLAELLLKFYCQKVIIVCLNSFLAHWAKTSFAKNNLN
jgi:superfamily II DNA or RNA helicase